MRALSLLLALALLLAATPPGLAQGPAFRCAPLLPSASRKPAYARVPKEERCEGYYEQTVSQAFIELLSLTMQRLDTLPSSADGVLRIAARSSLPLQLLIQPLRPSPFYRVDARLRPRQALMWDPAPMLAHTGLRRNELGFLARNISSDADFAGAAPLSLAAGAENPALAYAVLRVSVPVKSIAARQYVLGGAGSGESNWRELPGTPLYAWDTIVLPIDMAGATQDSHVDVRALAADGRLLPLLQFLVLKR
ncbi:hypothetical protein HSX11_08480 [Oxalobacteraceae bacterium]|nr:hypothetical protein [Oxalobacteraceae bacterium]